MRPLFSPISSSPGTDGVEFEFAKGEGPVFHHPLRERKDVERLRVIEPEEDIPFLLKAIRIVRKRIGRKGPFDRVLRRPFHACELHHRGGTFEELRSHQGLMYQDRPTWDALMEKLSEVLIRYLNAQIQSGVQAVQIFDSWVGCLTPGDYEEYVLPYSRKVMEGVGKSVPLIHFATPIQHSWN